MSLALVKMDGTELELAITVLLEHSRRVRHYRPLEADRCEALRYRLQTIWQERQQRNWPPRSWTQPSLPIGP
jgi:hypothetical protein